MSYDHNGNILTLKRYGQTEQSTPRLIDNLTYNYENAEKSNRLLKVTDSSNTLGFNDGNKTGNDYTYDINGNLKTDLNKGIEIEYNHLNLPTLVKKGAQTIEYAYSATGVKLRKIVKAQQGVNAGLTTTTTEYLDGFQYKDGVLQFFPTTEGYVNAITAGSVAYNYVYNLTDHLGNVRVSYAWDDVNSKLKTVNEDHYYPFGLQHKGYNKPPSDITIRERELIEIGVGIGNTSGSANYKYKFQGQERQEELGLNWDSFKWRNYMPDIGRFFNVDPLTEKYNTWSPYVFSGNRVIDARELEGLEPYIVTGRAFIPNKTLSNPNPFSKTTSFAGDNRNSYQVNTNAYRTEQKVRVDFGNKKATTISNRASGTIGYDKNGKVTATSTEGKAGPTPTYTPSTMDNKSTTIGMEVDAGNKLVTGAPAINYEVSISITETKGGTFDYSITGQSDGFPAYEFFITNEATGDSYLIHGSNPAATGDTPTALFPPMEKKIDASGNSKDLTPVDKEVKF